MKNKIVNKIKETPNSVKSSVALIISSLLVKGIAFIVTPLFTRLMDMDDFGIVTTYNSWASIIEVFAILGLTSAGVFNVGMKDNKKTRGEYISSCLGLCNLTTLITFIVVFIVKILLGENSTISYEMLGVMFIHFLFSPAQIFWLTRQRYEYKYKLSTIISIGSVLLSQLLSVLFVMFADNKSFGKIFGNEIGVLLFAIPFYILLLKRGGDYINLKRWKQILVLSLPLIPHYLAQHIMGSSDKIMITHMTGAADSAIYGVVMNIGLIGTIFWNAINASLVPYSFDKIEKRRYKDIDKLSKKLITGYSIILLFVILLAPEILAILAPASYSGGIYCVPPLTFAVFTQALYNLFANIEFYNKKTSGIAAATVGATIINLILNWLLIPKFSYVGASYATLIADIALIFFHYLNYKRTKTNNIYDVRYIFILSVTFLVVSLLAIPLYNIAIVRYVLLLAIILTAIFARKYIIRVIRTMSKK